MSDREMGWLQAIVGLAFIVGYFGVIAGFMLGFVQVPDQYREAFVALLGVVTASVTQILSYFFARQRPVSTTGGTS